MCKNEEVEVATATRLSRGAVVICLDAALAHPSSGHSVTMPSEILSLHA